MARVIVVGSGWRFTSGISYYTCRLSNELARDHDVSALLMRGLMPRRLYPGRDRVGLPVNSSLDYLRDIRVYDGVDWFWGPSFTRALRFIRQMRPEVVVLQWWTGAVLHSYLAIAAQARRVGARVIIEFHEAQDTGEARLPLVKAYVGRGLPRLMRHCDAIIVHSTFDRAAVETAFGRLPDVPVVVVPHGPYDQHRSERPSRRAPGDVVRLLFFGTIRPYKGLEDLLAAFDLLDPAEADGLELHVVGETWEGWTLPLEMIEQSRYRDRIHVVNRYVTDAEVAAAFAAADVVVLPYRRSSSSGPLHIAMASGLPVVVSAVGGLVESSQGYGGLVAVPPADPASLRDGIRRGIDLAGRSYADVRSWQETRSAFSQLLDRIGAGRSSTVDPGRLDARR